MKTELIEHSPTRKELHIEIDAEQMRLVQERVIGNYTRQANVPGFRPGKAPQSVVRQRFKDDIRSDVLREVVPEVLHYAILEHGLQVLGEPDVHLADEDQTAQLGNAPLKLHAHVEVLPDFEIGQYKGLDLTRRVRPVTDEDVAEVIDNLRESSASLAPVEDRASQAGDTVTVNFNGRYIQPPDQEDIKAEEVDVVVGGEGVLPIFSENLTGVREGDERTFTVAYPEDFSSKGLAGKEIEYTAQVVAVRIKELPELDDDFAKSVSEEVSTFEELKTRIRDSLTERANMEATADLRNEAMERLITAHQLEVPQSLVTYQSRAIIENFVRDMMRGGVDPRQQEINWDTMRAGAERQATDELRGSMVLERIADDENLEASREEIEAEIQAYARVSRQPISEVRDTLTKQGGDRSIADSLRNRKALDLVVASANVTEGEWREPEDITMNDATDDESPVAETSSTADSSDANSPNVDSSSDTVSAADADTADVHDAAAEAKS
ncbi:MAG: trigger factor [Pyrinomonadaceae bacterium MAG19_C2-C3]|nr:trigger factor [Pyrinomonadaceae bacterium MAG19_C2-C3]